MSLYAIGAVCLNAVRHVRFALKSRPWLDRGDFIDGQSPVDTKVRPTGAVIRHMNADKIPYTDTRSALNAAEEALELLCRLRRVPIASLSDAELGEFFFNALEDELGGAEYWNKKR
jgi:hypothetical protein